MISAYIIVTLVRWFRGTCMRSFPYQVTSVQSSSMLPPVVRSWFNFSHCRSSHWKPWAWTQCHIPQCGTATGAVQRLVEETREGFIFQLVKAVCHLFWMEQGNSQMWLDFSSFEVHLMTRYIKKRDISGGLVAYVLVNCLKLYIAQILYLAAAVCATLHVYRHHLVKTSGVRLFFL